MAVIGAVLGDIAGSQFEFHRPAEEYYHGVGFDPEPVLKRYLDERMYGILKMKNGK